MSEVELQLKLLKRKKKHKFWRGATPSPVRSPVHNHFHWGESPDPEAPISLSSHERSHIKQSTLDKSTLNCPKLSVAAHFDKMDTSPRIEIDGVSNISSSPTPALRVSPSGHSVMCVIQCLFIDVHHRDSVTSSIDVRYFYLNVFLLCIEKF